MLPQTKNLYNAFRDAGHPVTYTGSRTQAFLVEVERSTKPTDPNATWWEHGPAVGASRIELSYDLARAIGVQIARDGFRVLAIANTHRPDAYTLTAEGFGSAEDASFARIDWNADRTPRVIAEDLGVADTERSAA